MDYEKGGSSPEATWHKAASLYVSTAELIANKLCDGVYSQGEVVCGCVHGGDHATVRSEDKMQCAPTAF